MNSDALRLLERMYDACSGPYSDLPNLNDSYTQLRALLSAQEPTGWRPIETAPKDGTTILVYRPIHDGAYIPMVGVDHMRMRAPYQGCWGRSRTDTPPAAWMPLPAPPGELAKQEAK